MKKQSKIIIGVVMALAVIIIAVSFFYPTVFKGLTSGTFGKADKYHSTQMTEKDVLLRSEFVGDTSQLRNMIQGLIYFSMFTHNLSSTIDSCILVYNGKGIGGDPQKQANLAALQDFSEYIKNNNKILQTTISMLTGFYLKVEADQSADVEKNLRDFSSYVSNLNEKDSVLNKALLSMDNFVLTNKALRTKKTEIASLKSIRDQLLLQGVQLGGLLQDKELCSQLLGNALSSQPAFNIIVYGKEQLGVLNQDKLGILFNQDKLGNFMNSVSFGSNEQLGNIIQAQQLGRVVGAKQDLGIAVGSVVVYDKASLQYMVGNKSELQKALSSGEMSAILNGTAMQGSIQGVAVFASEGLKLYQSNIDLKSGFGSQLGVLGNSLSSSQLNSMLSGQQGIGAVSYGSSFIGMSALCNKQLGITSDN